MGGTIGIPRGDMYVVMGGPAGQLGVLRGEPENGLNFRTLWAPPAQPPGAPRQPPVRVKWSRNIPPSLLYVYCKVPVERPSMCEMATRKHNYGDKTSGERAGHALSLVYYIMVKENNTRGHRSQV